MSWELAAGDVLAHYRVVSPLGAGGMGQVYLAEDLRLGRRIALKVLSTGTQRDEKRLARFEREARAISALNHPNILTIYDVGHAGDVQFLCTEYVDGVTLRVVLTRERLAVPAAVEIAIQMAQALAAAHDAGVVHRDVKPENVMVRKDGYVKVLDFGLAKLMGREPQLAGADDDPTRLMETAEGVVMGTFNYMAPEQAQGRDLDARADLFSLGVVLYEMLAGRPPFHGRSAADVVGALLLRDPEPLHTVAGVPADLERIVVTALRKDADERYQSGAEIARDLRSLRLSSDTRGSADVAALATTLGSDVRRAEASRTPLRTPSPAPEAKTTRAPAPRRTRRRIESLAVLPLLNDSSDRDLDYLGDGLTESLINNLSQVPRLRVMARSTVFALRGQQRDPRAVGRDLGVQAVLTGRVAQRGSVYVVAAELVDVDDGSQLWGATVNRPLSDVFVLQAEIAQELAGALRLRLTRAERKRLVKQHTANPTAYQLYLRGRYLLNDRTGDALKRARALFERAVQEDPAYALAHAGLADCCSLLAVSLRSSNTTVLARARSAAEAALQIDGTLAEGHASLAFIKFRFDWQWAAAEEEFARSLRLNPGHAPSRQWHAMFLASRSRFDEALDEMQRALQLDPLSLIIQTGLGRILHFARRYDEAANQYEHVLDANPDFAQARVDLALTRMAVGDLAAARRELTRAEEVLGPVSTILLLRLCCAVRGGAGDEARALFEQLRVRQGEGTAGADDLAMAAAALADWDAARAWLTEACRLRAPFLGYVDVEPAMAPLLQDEACCAILRRHGFDAVAQPPRLLSRSAP